MSEDTIYGDEKVEKPSRAEHRIQRPLGNFPGLATMGNVPSQEEDSHEELDWNQNGLMGYLPRLTTPDVGNPVATKSHEGEDRIYIESREGERESAASLENACSNHWMNTVLCNPVEGGGVSNSSVKSVGLGLTNVDHNNDVAEISAPDGRVDELSNNWHSLEATCYGLVSLAQQGASPGKTHPEETASSSKGHESKPVDDPRLGTQCSTLLSYNVLGSDSSSLSSGRSSVKEEWKNDTSTLKLDEIVEAAHINVEAVYIRSSNYQTTSKRSKAEKRKKGTKKNRQRPQQKKGLCHSSCGTTIEQDIAGEERGTFGASLGSALFCRDRRTGISSEPLDGGSFFSTTVTFDTHEDQTLRSSAYLRMSAENIEDVTSISDPEAHKIDTSDFARRSSRPRKQPVLFMDEQAMWKNESKKSIIKTSFTPNSSLKSTIPAKRAGNWCSASCTKSCCFDGDSEALSILSTEDSSIRLEEIVLKRAKTQNASHCEATVVQDDGFRVQKTPSPVSDSCGIIQGSAESGTIYSHKLTDIFRGAELLSKITKAQESGELSDMYNPSSVRFTNQGWMVRKRCMMCATRNLGGCDRASPCNRCAKKGLACEEKEWEAPRGRRKKAAVGTTNDKEQETPARTRQCRSLDEATDNNQDSLVTNPGGPALRSPLTKEIFHKEDTRPLPRGQPKVWSIGRQALCETLPYYRAYQSGAYTHDNLTFGCLVDNMCSERDYMDSEIVITRAGGGLKKNPETGEMEQIADHTLKTKTIENFKNNMRTYTPVAVIVGNRNPKCPTKIPFNYCVLGWFKVTEVWCEKVNGMKEFKFRFEKLDLEAPSWWAPIESQNPPRPCLFPTPALRQRCNICGKSSPQIYTAGWMCLTDSCYSFWKINGIIPSVDLEYNPAFLQERTPWPHKVKPAYDLKPRMLPEDRGNDTGYSVSRACWKGFACPECGRCNSREDWDAWRCQRPGCDFTYNVKRSLMSVQSVSNPNDPIADGHAVSKDIVLSPVMEKVDFLENYRVHTYTIPGCGTVTHFMANRKINEGVNGPDDLFMALQQANIGLKRFALKNSPLAGPMLTQHFAVNHGMPYKYIVDVDSKSFSGAPEAIHHARARLNWAGKHVVQDETFTKFNELLTLGYFEKQKINYHDDGEAGLGPTIATLSLGAQATMSIRMKVGHYTGVSKVGAYVDKQPPRQGCLKYEQRLAKHNEIVQASSTEPSMSGKMIIEELGLSRRKSSPVCLSMRLNHGDVVVMHGSKIQTYYEHAVEPSGKLRFAMTCRYVDPKTVNPEHWWKATYDENGVPPYDGDEGETQLASPPLSAQDLGSSPPMSEQTIG